MSGIVEDFGSFWHLSVSRRHRPLRSRGIARHRAACIEPYRAASYLQSAEARHLGTHCTHTKVAQIIAVAECAHGAEVAGGDGAGPVDDEHHVQLARAQRLHRLLGKPLPILALTLAVAAERALVLTTL